MFVAWIVFPLLLGALCVGCGLLVERACGRRLPGALLPSVGLALLIVALLASTSVRLGAQLAPVIALALAASGYLLGWERLRGIAVDRWAVATGAATFAALSLPVIAIGSPTFLGYNVLNDSSFQFVLVDWIFEHGRTPPADAVSSFERIAQTYLESSYPVGALMPLGAAGPLVGTDVAWIFQPYLALVLALAAAALYSLLDGVATRQWRALIAFLALVAGLVLSYYSSANIKELTMLWALVASIAVAIVTFRIAASLRALIAPALLLGAAIGVLNVAALPWIALSAFVLVGFLWRSRRAIPWAERSTRIATGAGLAALALVVALSADSLRRFSDVASVVLTDPGGLGNLVEPVPGIQVFGIWLREDFRFPLEDFAAASYIFTGVAICGAVLGIFWLVRRRHPGLLLLLGSALLAAAVLIPQGSPYADAKTLMIITPAVVVTALLGALALRDSGRRVEAVLLTAAIATGVVWTDILVLRGIQGAPHERYEELATMAVAVAGSGATLYPGFDEFAAHFAREADPRAASTYQGHRRRPGAPRREGERQKHPHDLDHLEFDYVESFRNMIVPVSPADSRPPAGYDLATRGNSYELWQRRSDAPEIIEHLPLGDGLDPAGVPPCPEIRRLAARAERMEGRIAYVTREPLYILPPGLGRHPVEWERLGRNLLSMPPRGALTATLQLPDIDLAEVWIEGQFPRKVEVTLGGEDFSAGPQIGPLGQMLLIGEIEVGGEVDVSIRPTEDGPLAGGDRVGRLGPLVISAGAAESEVRSVSPTQAVQLCGQRLDWIEVVRELAPVARPPR